MSEFENIPEKIEEVAQEEIVREEQVAEAIGEAIEEAAETPAEIAEEIIADVAAEEPVVIPEAPVVVPELEPAADAAMNFIKETDEFTTEYLKETMPGFVPEEPVIQPAIMPAQEAAPAFAPEISQMPEASAPLPPENVDFGSKPFAQEIPAAPMPQAAAPEAPAPQEIPAAPAWTPVEPVAPAAQVPPVQPAPAWNPVQPEAPTTAAQQFQQYQQQQSARAAQMNQQFQQYQQNRQMGPQNPSETQNSPYMSPASGAAVGGFATGYTGGADTAWQSQPNNIEARPNPSFGNPEGPQPSYSGPFEQFAPGGQGAQPTGQSPYGQPNYGYQQYQQPRSSSEDPGYTMSVISMICGIVSCVMFWGRIGGIFALLAGIAAIILGVLSGKKSMTGRRNGMATAGLICGIVGVSLTVICLACWACACSYLAGGLGDILY